MKKLILLLCALFLFCPSITVKSVAIAEQSAYSQSESDIEENLNEETESQLDDLDFSSLDEILKNLSSSQLSIFGEKSFIEKVRALLSGEYQDGTGLWQAIINVFLESLLSLMPIVALIVGISVLASMIQGLKPTGGKSIGNLIHFVTYGVIVVVVLTIVVRMVSLTTNTITNLKSQMDCIFPILLTLLTAIGGEVSVAVYQPAMALLSSVILNFFTYILMPLFVFSVVINVISNLSNTVKLDKLASCFNSTFKWIIGFVFTIFTAFLSIQGITAGAVDGISIRTAKFAIRSYVPILGSYLSDGMGLILTSSNLIKNTVGGAGLFLLLATVLSPLIELVLFMLVLKFASGIIEPLGNKQVANFISSLSKSMVLLVVIIIGVSFVYFIMLGLVMCSANIF